MFKIGFKIGFANNVQPNIDITKLILNEKAVKFLINKSNQK